MIQIKQFTKGINTRIISYHLTCKVVIDGKEHEVSAIVSEDDNDTQFDWNYGYENISEEYLDELELEMLDRLFN